jgi:hypothetical protein
LRYVGDAYVRQPRCRFGFFRTVFTVPGSGWTVGELTGSGEELSLGGAWANAVPAHANAANGIAQNAVFPARSTRSSLSSSPS